MSRLQGETRRLAAIHGSPPVDAGSKQRAGSASASSPFHATKAGAAKAALDLSPINALSTPSPDAVSTPTPSSSSRGATSKGSGSKGNRAGNKATVRAAADRPEKGSAEKASERGAGYVAPPPPEGKSEAKQMEAAERKFMAQQRAASRKAGGIGSRSY